MKAETNHQNQRRVTVDIDGKCYTLAMDVDAMCAIEELFSTPEHEATFVEVMQRAERGSMRAIRAVWWASLRSHHPELTIEQASTLIAGLGGIQALSAKLAEAAQAAAPAALKTKATRSTR